MRTKQCVLHTGVSTSPDPIEQDRAAIVTLESDVEHPAQPASQWGDTTQRIFNLMQPVTPQKCLLKLRAADWFIKFTTTPKHPGTWGHPGPAAMLRLLVCSNK